MEKLTAAKVLQMHGIEAAPDDSRRTEQIVADYIATGRITLSNEVQIIGLETRPDTV